MTKLALAEQQVTACACVGLVGAFVVGDSIVLAQMLTPSATPVYERRALPSGMNVEMVAAVDARGESFITADGTLYGWRKGRYQRALNVRELLAE
jgi:hypothetical protein